MDQVYLPGKIRDRIQDLMKSRKVTQAELAARIGCSESSLSRFISGKTDKLGDESIIRIARAFEVSTDFLLGEVDELDRKNYDISELGLSVEAGLLGPLGGEVGDLWATFSIFGVGAALTFLLMLFFSPRNSPSFFAQPGWQLLGGVLGPVYVVILTIATPTIGIALTMIGILAGQVFKSLIIDHFGLLGTPHMKINAKRIVAPVFIIAALVLVAQG